MSNRGPLSPVTFRVMMHSRSKIVRVRKAQFVAACGVIAAAWLAVATARAQSVFEIDKTRPTRVVVTPTDQAPTLPAPEMPSTDMLRRLAGVLGVLEKPDDLRAILGTGPAAARFSRKEGEDADELSLLCTLHLTARAKGKRVTLARARDGEIVAEELDPNGEKPIAVVLAPDKIEPLLHEWAWFRGDFSPPKHTPGVVFEMKQPYRPGAFAMTKHTLGRRFLQRSSTNIDAANRALANSKLVARLPKGYDPKAPAGLIVWVSPSPGAGIPRVFDDALDELGIIAVGFESAGNTTPAGNRYQWVFDCIATAAARFHVDPRRVYITGMSGGGRVASILWGCFPDVFAGAVPIVGMCTYTNVPNGVGQFWPQGYVKPDSERLRLLGTRRMGAMTGFPDFNHPEMVAAAKIMQRDKLPVRVFEYDDMGHDMPTAERFLSVLSWVDEPYREARAKEAAAAATLLKEYQAKFEGKEAATPEQRRALAAITAAGPWTPAAWEAAEMLGFRADAPTDVR